MISPSLKQKVAIKIFSKVVLQNKRLENTFKKSMQDTLKQSKQLNAQVGQNPALYEKVLMQQIGALVTRLSTALASPDDVLVDQNDETHDMYLIAKGECMVKITSSHAKLEEWKTLRPGDYFGEIAMIYESKRTAQVMSVKYSTLAKLTQHRYRELITEVPEITKDLKEGIFKIKDRNKQFLIQNLEKIPYF